MVVSDETLATKILNGDTGAFEELLTRYDRMVYKVAYRMMGQKEEAEDIAQEVFVTVYRKIGLFDPTQKFSAWLYRITVNTCISRLRSRSKPDLTPFDETFIPDRIPGNRNGYDPLVVLEQKELRQQIWQAMLNLSENYRAMLILRYQMGLSNQEIAETLGIKKDNVEVGMHRARKALRQQLAVNYWNR